MPKNHHKTSTTSGLHLPVLVNEVLAVLDPQKGESYLDMTAGFGGHASAVLQLTVNPTEAILVDRDKEAVDYLQRKFASQKLVIMHRDFLGACQDLSEQGRQFDLILADLGTSSVHLDQAKRGFSIQNAGPLDMRMDQSQPLSAADIVNQWDEADIAKILKDFGEEPKAKAIARQIVAARPLKTTQDLVVVVGRAWHGFSRVHPATRTFQALRIAVNSELTQLEQSLPLMQRLLAPGGRLGVISFHSLEDRIVKRFLAEEAGGGYDSEMTNLTKKPITASHDELVSNPRARSAKLRAAAKIKTKRKE